MRFLAVILLAITLISYDAEAANNRHRSAPRVQKKVSHRVNPDAQFSPEKYAALVMDVKTGELLHSRNIDARRYPASLTKMMTLYLLFEAMEKGKVSARTLFTASAYASTQPQTNLSLNEGDRIPVDIAIRALVVRSANDVAVVVAENLAGSVDAFAVRMTEKAHALGMNNTVFKNPNGLPNSGQFTTARDLAKLAVALRRDFPQYYGYFAVRQFSWNRVPYVTHNRVMLRYAGADGVKTGFIGASGFNVVTSVKRNGVSLVGVVMGGSNAKIRDDRMITLLEDAQKTLATRRGNKTVNSDRRNLPLQVRGAKSARAAAPVIEESPENTPEDTTVIPPASEDNDDDKTVLSPSVTEAPSAQDVAKSLTSPIPFGKGTPAPVEVAPTPAPAALPEAPASSAAPAETRAAGWGIQVGAFEDKTQAENAVNKALTLASSALGGARIAVNSSDAASKTIHRARIDNVREDQARKACQILISQKVPCFTYQAN
jgi:D-alanyl-D-alanine carboxypeptidase